MEAKKASMNEIFLRTRILKIPFFQRSYVWEKDNWEQFYNDIAQSVLNAKENGTPETYFMGCIILKQAGFDSSSQEVCEVIDGQQRLTTTVLFMKALFLYMDRNDLFRENFMLQSLSNENSPILVTGYNDSNIYTNLLNQDSFETKEWRDSKTQELIVPKMEAAYSYFAERMQKSFNGIDEDYPVTPMEMYRAVLNYLRLICITLDEKENAQKIFETINNTGIRLTTGDMLKNYLYDEDHIEEYERTWKDVFEGDDQLYWSDDIMSGNRKSNHIDNFFCRYMLIKTQDEVIKKHLSPSDIKSYRKQDGLYEKFKGLIEKCKLTKEEMLEDVVDCARLYKDTFKKNALDEALPQNSAIERIVGLMYASNVWTMTPYILYVLRTQADEAERGKLFSYLETYLVRRIICGSTNNSYSDLFSENLVGNHINTYEGFKSYVNDDKARGTLLMPSDDNVREALNSKDQKQNSSVLLYVFESKLNDNFVDGKHTNGYNSFKVEQIMPEKENKEWRSSSYTDKDCERLVKTLGNFILLREKLKTKEKKGNRTKKIAAMSTKVDDLVTIAVPDLNAWNEESIEKRNNWFAEKAIECWPIEI